MVVVSVLMIELSLLDEVTLRWSRRAKTFLWQSPKNPSSRADFGVVSSTVQLSFGEGVLWRSDQIGTWKVDSPTFLGLGRLAPSTPKNTPQNRGRRLWSRAAFA